MYLGSTELRRRISTVQCGEIWAEVLLREGGEGAAAMRGETGAPHLSTGAGAEVGAGAGVVEGKPGASQG